MNCTPLSLNGTTGWWRRLRVAYLNTNNGTPVSCPPQLEVKPSPPSCRQGTINIGRSSVVFETRGLLYTQGLQVGTQDGFTKSTNTTVDDNYVDGVVLLHGNSKKTHIWTFAAASTRTLNLGCDICDQNRPSFIENNYSCEFLPQQCPFGQVCNPDQLWDGNQGLHSTGICHAPPQTISR